MESIVTIQFRQEDQAEIMARIPLEQARVKELREQGLLEAIYIGADFRHVWLVMQGESQEQIQKALESFPLYPYMHYEIVPLSRM